MSDNFSGYVLRDCRIAPANAETTAGANNGVGRDVKALPSNYRMGAYGPEVVEAAADQYRAAILNSPIEASTEYLVFAANDSQLARVEDSLWGVTGFLFQDQDASTDDTPVFSDDNIAVSFTTGSLAVGTFDDGTNKVLIQDKGGKSIADVESLKIVRGDTSVEITATSFAPGTDFDAGLLFLTSGDLTLLGGGISKERGDFFIWVKYVIAASRFWWTRNDISSTRFGWKGKRQRWEPFNGSVPTNIGTLELGETYKLSPRPNRYVEGAFLPGFPSPGGDDQYCMVRLGLVPDSNSFPVAKGPGIDPNGVKVVNNDSASGQYNFSADPDKPAAVLGVSNGILQWDQTFVETHAGESLWYSFELYDEKADGKIGKLLEGTHFIAPVPFPTERPFISLGSRRPLSPILVMTEAELGTLTVLSGQVGVALSTGQLKFNQTDIDRADPDEPTFDKQYMNVEVIHAGVALNQASQPTMEAVKCTNIAGTPTTVGLNNHLYVPNGQFLPEVVSNIKHPTGLSGMLHVPDETGALPTTGTPGIRPGGDNSGDITTGLVRDALNVGDLIFFSNSGAIEEVIPVDLTSDLPDFPFQIDKGKIYLAREYDTIGSRVAVSLEDRKAFLGKYLYFLQAALTPSIYTDQAAIYSRNRGPFIFDGTEKLYFAVGSSLYTWSSSSLGAAGSYTAEEVAVSIDTLLPPLGGQSYAFRDYVVIAAEDPDDGEVEIGFGNPNPNRAKDLSAANILGFLPGWRVDTRPAIDTAENWLPDAGVSVGLFRSPVNLDRTQTTPDFQSRGRVEDTILFDRVPAQSKVFLDYPPLQDVVGIDEDIFFEFVTVIQRGLFTQILKQRLENYDQVLYEFVDGQFVWLEEHLQVGIISQPVQSLSLGQVNAIPESFLPALGGKLVVAASGGQYQPLVYDEDFVIGPGNGSVLLIGRVGDLLEKGYQGSFTSGLDIFTDPSVDFTALLVQDGYWLKVLGGDATGFYQIEQVPTPTTLKVTPEFLADSGSLPVQWEIYKGVTDSEYDEGLVADALYQTFNHLPVEPFQIRVLSSVGTVPLSVAAQSSDRRKAQVADALASGRTINIRIEQTNTYTFGMIQLSSELLGLIANSTLFVPGASPVTARFTNGDFSVQLGGDKFTYASGNLVPVPAFTVPIPAGRIEYLTTTGELGFAPDVLTDYASSEVYYIEEFLAPASFTTPDVEFQGETGELNFSAEAISVFGGKEAYFVEQMITENRQDVAVSPMNGAFGFIKPLLEMRIVEVHYFQADLSGNKALDSDDNPIEITEFLPLYVRLEECTRIDEFRYSFNPTGRTVIQNIETEIYVGINMQNFGEVTAVLDFDANEIVFLFSVPSTERVQISYAVRETFGGESNFSASTPPIYRPPFYVEVDQNTFTLVGDRTEDVKLGQLMRLGASPFYIQNVVYNSTTQETTVTLFPTPTEEAGVRSPGNDVLTLLTPDPITTSVGAVPVPDASAGFFLTVSTPYEAVAKKFQEMKFEGDTDKLQTINFTGDITQFAVAGHMMEVGGYPFIIAGSDLSEDGMYTTVNLTSPFPKDFNYGIDVVKISARPVYPPGPRGFLGKNPVLESEGYELIRTGSLNDDGDELPGVALTPAIDYILDPDSGAIRLNEPNEEPLGAGEKLYLRYTKKETLTPLIQNGVVVIPRYQAQFLFETVPSDENSYLGALLKATYTFSNPDTFYFRSMLLQEFLTEVESDVTAKGSSRISGGPMITTSGGQENYDQGNLSLDGQRRDLVDKDRAARSFLSFYNLSVVLFEQVLEAIDGQVIGDWDGKFRFHIGRGKDFTPPGFEDAITGELVPRNLWREVFLAANTVAPIIVTTEDNIVNPLTATLSGGVLDGNFLNADDLRDLIRKQKDLVRNDVDDLLLLTTERPSLHWFFVYRAKGIYEIMGDSHKFSRIFPEQTRAFFTTYPGLMAELPYNLGVYSPGKMIEPPSFSFSEGFRGPKIGSTADTTIGKFANPVIGPIENIVDAVVYERRPRARVWAYSPTGFGGFVSASANRPAVIATPLALKDFPIDPDTGFPDTLKLRAQSGNLDDLSSGVFENSIPPFEAKEQIAFGQPNGTTYDVGDAGKILGIFSANRLAGVFVESVEEGCVLLFQDADGNSIMSPNQIVRLKADPSTGEPLDVAQGDTVYIVPPGGTAEEPNDPPTTEDMETLAKSMPTYSVGWDLAIRKKEGELVDHTFSSFFDPSFLGWKEIVGQKPPKPGDRIEAEVRFIRGNKEPLKVPALLGEARDDSGDQTIPYLASGNTELDRFDSIANNSHKLLTTKSVDGTLYVYPDEVLGDDGSIIGAFSTPNLPATLITAQDIMPVFHGSSEQGIGDVGRYDLLFVEVDDSESKIAKGAQGILSVGETTYNFGNNTSQLEPPRFVTQSRSGDRCRYTMSSAMTHIGGANITGMTIQDTSVDTFLAIGTVPVLNLNDGNPVGSVGGLNTIINNGVAAYPNGNAIGIFFYDVAGVWFEFLIIQGVNVVSSTGVGVLTGPPVFEQQFVTLPGITGLYPVLAPSGGPPSIPQDFSISLDVAGSSPYPANIGTDTAWVDSDRLTFREGLDLRTALPRGSQTGSAINIEFELEVHTVEGPTSDDITVNHPNEINGGSAFSFVPRNAGGAVGYFDPAPLGTGMGFVKVMGFEGFNNAPILPVPGKSLTFSAIPSSYKDENAPPVNGEICIGGGYCDGANYSSGAYDNRITEIDTTALLGSLDKIQKNDLLVIDRAIGAGALATTKAGSYLVRHAVESTDLAYRYRAVTLTAVASAGTGWLGIEFPTVVGTDPSGNGTITITEVGTLLASPSNTWFANSGWVYIIYVDDKENSEVVGAQYNSIAQTPTGFEFTLTGGLGGYKDKDNVDIPLANLTANFWGEITAGMRVSGMVFLPVQISGEAGLPDHNVVGYTTGTIPYGFDKLTVFSDSATPRSETLDSSLGTIVNTVPSAGKLVVKDYTPNVGWAFSPYEDAVVYENVPSYVDLRGLDENLHAGVRFWYGLVLANRIHVYRGAQCIIPSDTFITADDAVGTTPSYFAQAGIFLEPSFPRSVFDLSSLAAHIVDQGHSLTANEVGQRTGTDFGLPGGPEGVKFTVKRVRRWHDAQEVIGQDLIKLGFAYEIRRGEVSTYIPNAKQQVVMSANLLATQLGSFTDVDVNINAGDVFRLIDTDGSLIDEAEIVGVLSDFELLLAAPGITAIPAASIPGKQFEIYLKKAPVPHEQTNEQLLDLITDAEIYRQTADYTAQTGGYVPDLGGGDYADFVNQLYDDDITGAGGNTFSAQGVLLGDIVILDSAGQVQGPTGTTTPPEKGIRPFGDVSVFPRAVPFTAGRPAKLDDNRGFYEVTKIEDDHLEVRGSSLWASAYPDLEDDPIATTIAGNKIFPNDEAEAATWGYAVYPTISGSLLNETGMPKQNREGQMDLRPTAKAGTNGSPADSFDDNYYSIRPFSYRIIRPSLLFTEETIELILSIRERMLSWIEELGLAIQGAKSGSYWIFQRDEHISDLGSPTIPDEGLGLLSNAYLFGLTGLTDISPFANNSDCLSVLDRRFWILDFRLDSLKPPGALPGDPTYAEFADPSGGGVVRPVLPDHIDIVLNQRDRLRDLRYTWLSYRTQIVNGTLTEITRFDEQLPEKREEERQLVLRKLSLDKA